MAPRDETVDLEAFGRFSELTWPIPYLLSLRHTSMKGRTTRGQIIVISGVTGAMTAFFLVVAWIADKIEVDAAHP